MESSADDFIEKLNALLSDGMDDVLHRLSALEEKRGLSPIGFSMTPSILNSSDALHAKMALANWRLTRLETF